MLNILKNVSYAVAAVLVIVGMIMTQAGPNGFFAFIGVLMTCVAIYGLYRMTQRATADDTGPFVTVPSRMSPVAVEIATEIAIEEAELLEEDDTDSEQTPPQ